MDTILITVDALRPDHLRQYGYERDTMPVLDRLVDGGTVFTSAFANGTNTGISLPSLFTSRYLGDGPATAGPTLPSALGPGVETVGVHSNTYLSARVGRLHGFDRYEEFGVGEAEDDTTRSTGQALFRRAMDVVRPTVERLGVRDAAEAVQRALFPTRLIHETTPYTPAEETTDRTLELVDGVPDDRDLFLWVHYMDPHRPFTAHVDDPAYAPDLEADEIHDLMSRAGITPEAVDDADRDLLVDLYDSELRYLDGHLRRLFDGLVAADRWRDAQVIFTADHGEEFGEHGRYYHRNRPYDELLAVPLVVRGPTLSPGEVVEQRELLDVAPTVCAAHGVDAPSGFLGRPLAEGPPREVVATGSFRDPVPVVAVRADGWKFIEVDDHTELYDLGRDPAEQESVAADQPERASAMAGKVPVRLREEDHSAVPVGDDERVTERLAELGYLE